MAYSKNMAKEIGKKLPDRTLFTRLLNDRHADINDDCLTQMGYVVDYLYDNQIPYHIEQTTSGGYLQLQAVTDSPKARITLTGNGNHIDFIGSGIKANQRYAYTATPYDKNGRSLSSKDVANRTYRPSREDVCNLLDAYLKNNMTAFAAPDQSRTLTFTRGKNLIPNTYYQNGKLRKGYRTVAAENGIQKDVELLIQPIQANMDGESLSETNSLITISNAIKNSHDYLVEEIMHAAPYMAGKKEFLSNGIQKTVCDYDIDNGEIQDMAHVIRDQIQDSDSEYGIAFAEAANQSETLQNIVSDYVYTNVLGLSKNANNEIVNLPVISDRSYVVSDKDIPEGFTFDPNAVSNWTALSENENNVVTRQKIQSSMRGLGLTKDNISGDDNRNATMADALIQFDESTAKTKNDYQPGSFEYRILTHTENYLKDLGIDATCRFDDNGLIDVSGNAKGRLNNQENNIPVHAVVGQIFAPDENNVVHVKRNRNDNFLFVPGYRAWVEEDDGSGKNLMERTVLTGYFDSACASIDDALSPLVNSASRALSRSTPSNINIAIPTACNSVYGETYGTRLSETYMEDFMNSGFDKEDVLAIYKALSGKIAYSREMDSDATTISSIGGESQKTRALEIAGQNLREMGDECLGYVYTNMTNTGRGSGTRRYLCDTAKVAEDGHIIKGDENDLTSSLFKRPMFEGVNHNALDRNVMAFSQIITAQGIEKHAKGCHMTIDGWTLDDGYIISKEFADNHMVTDSDGNKRPLHIGDKISDMNGNKGVVNIIIDRNMSIEQAKKKELLPLVQLMKENPDIDFIGAPYSGMSRSNAGTAFSMMKNHEDLKLTNGEVIKGGIGELPILITGMTIDTKTHVYDENSDHQRNSSGQLSWMLSSKKLTNIAKEIYGDNESGLNELRAYLNIIGVTLDEKGNLMPGFGGDSKTINRAQLVNDMSEDDGSGLMKVKKFDEYVLDTTSKQPNRRNKLHLKNSAAKWNAEAKNFNGFIQLPFPVQGADGTNLEVTVKDADNNDQVISVMPIVSSAYRSDVKHYDNETYSHDYTKNYADIIRAAGEYMSASTRISELIVTEAQKQNLLPDGWTPDQVKEKFIDIYSSRTVDTTMPNGKVVPLHEGFQDGLIVNGNITTCHKYMNQILKTAMKENPDISKIYQSLRNEQHTATIKGQSEYSNIVNDTISKKFEDRKHGAIISCMVKKGCKHSATAVWTADPRIDIDTVRMPQSMFDTLSVKDNHVLIWRDPLLRDEGMKYMKVEIDNDLVGIAVNPTIAKQFDGDFDGDSLGVMALQTEAAQKEAQRELSIQKNILDYGVGMNGKHPFALQNGMDVAAAKYADPSLAKRWDKLEERANDEFDNAGIISDSLFDEINTLVKDCLNGSTYKDIMSYESPEAVADSLVKMSKEYGDGSKGSIGKMKHFMEYFGYDCDVQPDGDSYKINVTVNPMSVEERLHRNKEVCTALGCKCDETGVAGYASQKAIRALRDICPTEALEETYPVTQGMLQAKHDAKEARLKAYLTQNVIPDLWEGKAMVQTDSGEWNIVHASSPNGTQSGYKQATKEEWKNQFMRIMCQANGIDIPKDANTKETRESFAKIMNPDALDKVADALSDSKGQIIGVTAKARDNVAFIDAAMYGVPFDKNGQKSSITDYIIDQAKKGTNIFDHGGMIFAPNSVHNQFGQSDVTTKSSEEMQIASSLENVNEASKSGNDISFQ